MIEINTCVDGAVSLFFLMIGMLIGYLTGQIGKINQKPQEVKE